MILKVVSYNLHKGRDRRQNQILHEAAHAIAERNPDLLMCQEVFHGIERDLEQCHFLTAVIGHDHVFGPNKFYPKGCHGNATFARLPVARHHNHDISLNWLERRGILHAAIEHEGRDIEVLNTHFSLTGRQRRRQWHRVRQALPSDPDLPVILAGDFNDWSGALDRRARRESDLENALWHLPRARRPTYPSHRPLFALDRIYVRGFDVREVTVLRGDPWNAMSDHLPVEAVLEMRT